MFLLKKCGGGNGQDIYPCYGVSPNKAPVFPELIRRLLLDILYSISMTIVKSLSKATIHLPIYSAPVPASLIIQNLLTYSLTLIKYMLKKTVFFSQMFKWASSKIINEIVHVILIIQNLIFNFLRINKMTQNCFLIDRLF